MSGTSRDCIWITAYPRTSEASAPKSTCRTTVSHCPRRVHSGAREALEVVLAHRLHLGWSRSHAAQLRAHAAPGRTLATNATHRRPGEADLVLGLRRRRTGSKAPGDSWISSSPVRAQSNRAGANVRFGEPNAEFGNTVLREMRRFWVCCQQTLPYRI